jgi:hypothetical protein
MGCDDLDGIQLAIAALLTESVNKCLNAECSSFRHWYAKTWILA